MTLDNDKARELFIAARDMPSAEREPFLDKECGEDDALHAEVDALLKHHDFTSAQTEGGETGGYVIDYEPGDTIEKFKIIDILGEGGMGIVYLAEQSKPVKRRVAIKVIKAGMDTKQVIARFEAERQALAIMNHAGIAHVYEAGATGEGRPYLVQEYVKGMPITEACDEHKLDTTQRLELLTKVCDAVQHAHMKGIIHRDLKPSNILVSLGEDDVLEPKIIDFGVAKATSQQLTEKTLVTQLGRFIGTPAYMSPEQADLKAIDIDTRTDVYALGVIAYEVLSGVPPFDPQTLREAGIEKMREIIRTQPPPKPSTRLSSIDDDDATKIAESHQIQLSALAGLLRKELEWIPLKALRKRRSERYDSAKSMGDDIRRYLKGEALEAGPESVSYRFKKTFRKHQGAFIATASIFLVLIAGIMSTLYLNDRVENLSNENQEIKQENKRLLEQGFRFIDDVNSNQIESSPDPAAMSTTSSSPVTPVVSTSSSDVQLTLSGDDAIVSVLGQIEATQILPLEGESATIVASRSKNPFWDSSSSLLDQLQALSAFLPEQEYERIYHISEILNSAYAKLSEEDLKIVNLNFNKAYNNLKSVNQNTLLICFTKKDANAVLLLLKNPLHEIGLALEVLVENADLNTLTMKEVAYLATGCIATERRELALELYNRKGVATNENSEYIQSAIILQSNIGEELFNNGEFHKAELEFESLLSFSESILGESNETTISLGKWIGCSLSYQEKYLEAEQVFHAWLDVSISANGTDTKANIELANWLAHSLYFQKKYAAAEDGYRAWLKISIDALGESNKVSLDMSQGIAASIFKQNRFQESELLLLKWYEICKAEYGLEHVETRWFIRWLAKTYDALDQPEKAQEYQDMLPESETSEGAEEE